MNQLALELREPVRVPEKGQLRALLLALEAGEHLTVAYALSQFGCYALSQRMGDLKRLGWPIQSRTIKTESGKHVSEYWL